MIIDEVIVTTTDDLPGYKIVKVLGMVSGSVVRARHLGRDLMATLRNIAGGEIKEYTELLAQARNDALKRMIEQAKKIGANAIVGVRFTTTAVASGAAEILVYGTAVVAEPKY